MKRLVLAAALTLGLAGCAQLQKIETAYDLATKSIANPVSRDDLYRVEAGIQIVFTALNAYKRACVQGVADANCRANVRSIQAYTQQVPPYLAQLRAFVRDDDQVNALVVYRQLRTLLDTIKTEAEARKVQL